MWFLNKLCSGFLDCRRVFLTAEGFYYKTHHQDSEKRLHTLGWSSQWQRWYQSLAMLLKRKTNEVDKHSKVKSLEEMFEAQSSVPNDTWCVSHLKCSQPRWVRCVFTGFRATFGEETAQLLKRDSTSAPVNGLGKVLKTPLLIMADQFKQQAAFQRSCI